MPLGSLSFIPLCFTLLPGLVLRLALGEMADELLLKGQRVVPRRLQEAGFEFRYNSLTEALSNLLTR